MHHVKLGDTGHSVVTNIQAIADLADATIASDHVLTLDLFSPAGFDVLHGRNHGIWALNKLFERNAEAVETGFALDDISLNGSSSAVPEPASVLLALTGFGILGGWMHRKMVCNKLG